jgi:uncharacterized membrane protein
MAFQLDWQSLVGISMLMLFSFIGMKMLEDKKYKLISFLIGVFTASILAGFDVEELFNKSQTYISEHADKAGIATSLTTMSLAGLSPFKGLRNTAWLIGGIGMVSSLFGNPSWIGFLIWCLILTVLGVLAYLLVKKFVVKQNAT